MEGGDLAGPYDVFEHPVPPQPRALAVDPVIMAQIQAGAKNFRQSFLQASKAPQPQPKKACACDKLKLFAVGIGLVGVALGLLYVKYYSISGDVTRPACSREEPCSFE